MHPCIANERFVRPPSFGAPRTYKPVRSVLLGDALRRRR